MAVTKVTLRKMDGGSSSLERNQLVYAVEKREYKLEFNVHVNSNRDDQIVVLSSNLLPQLGQGYSIFGNSDSKAICIDRVPTKLSPYLWYVDCTFSTEFLTAAITDNPLNQPPEISYDTILIERPLERDAFGFPVTNSANDYYDPPEKKFIKHQKITITQNIATFNKDQASTFTNATNDRTWKGYPPLTVQINSRRGTFQINNGVVYFATTTEIEIAPETFLVYLLDQGTRDINKNVIVDPRTAVIPSNPSLLNGRGRPIWEAKAKLKNDIDETETTIESKSELDVNKFPPNIVTNAFGAPVPPNNYFLIRIDEELMLVTDIGGYPVDGESRFTVQRGYAYTTAVSHNEDAVIQLEPYYRRYYNNIPRNLDDLNLPNF